MRAPWWLVDRLGAGVSDAVGAKVQDVATAVRVWREARVAAGATVVVTAATGAMGAMGALTVRMAGIFGANKVLLVGRNEGRLEAVRKVTEVETEAFVMGGGEGESLVERIRRAAPEGVQAIIDYLPSGDTIEEILPALSSGGALVHMGGNASVLSVPMRMIMMKGWRIVGCRGNSRANACEALKWIEEGKLQVEDLITHRFSLKEVDKAIQALQERSKPIWLSVIEIEQ